MMKKSAKIFAPLLCAVLGCCALAACGGDGTGGGTETPVPEGKVRVSFVDGNKTLSYTDIDKGAKVTMPTTEPTKSGYEFVRWYATPSYNIAFDFNEEIQKNISVFAGFRSTAADTHVWYLSGSSRSDLFKESGDWKEGFTDANVPASIKLEQDATKGNVFTITHDFFKGDQFQILNTVDGFNGTSFSGQVGYGYMNPDQYSTDTAADMYGKANPYDDGAKKSNITVGRSGNYTLKLTVDTNKNALTEISYVRNGDVENAETQYEFYITGEKLNEWNSKPLGYTHFATEDYKAYSLTIGMKAGDMFRLNSFDMDDKTYSWGPEEAAMATDADTAAAIQDIVGKNFGIKGGDGTYTFTLTYANVGGDDKVTLAAKKIADTLPEYSFYVKGNIGGDSTWATKHEMTKGADGKYSLEIDIASGEQFMICATEKDDLDKTVVDVTTMYAYDRLVSESIEYKGNNFAAKAADKFTITIDPHTMYVTIKGENDKPKVYGAVIKGSMNEWKPEKATAEQKVAFNGTLTGEITLDLAVGDNFMMITYDTADEKYTQIHYANAGGMTLCDGLEGMQNVECKKAGKYKFTVTIDAIGNIVSVVATAVTA